MEPEEKNLRVPKPQQVCNIFSLLLEGLEELSLHPPAMMGGINILQHPTKSPNAFIALR